MEPTQFIHEIEERKPHIVPLVEKLREIDKEDYYWPELLRLAGMDYFFEPCLVQNWIGARFQPKKILEIGTRTGGSLIALLSAYPNYNQVEVVSFDLWREYKDTTLLKKIPVLRHLPMPKSWIANAATSKVLRNLKACGIDFANIQFISGDSKITVPEYFQKNPGKMFDYILVDGAHDKPTAAIDLENIAAFVSKDGFIVFDDIAESYGLIDVWDNFKSNHANEFDFYEVFHRKGVAWAVRK